MKKLGLFTASAVEEMASGNECVEYMEGCLLDSFIFWNGKKNQYYLCLSHVITPWTSCYKVFAGDEAGIFDMWDRLIKSMECPA